MFNKPTQIGSTTFAYGPEHQRFKQVNGSKVTYTIGGDFEEVREGGQITQKAYIDGIALYSKTGTTGKLQYLHYDHLGSVETITDEAGAIVSRMSFNPWGERQMADWKTGTPSNLNTLPTTSSFTGHEHLDQLGLIHMGGRVYDPQVGHFLSADLFVQAPHFSQSFNRYSYVFNNPLSYTDPSGYQTTGCQATACEEVNTFGYSDSGDSGGWMRSGSWNYHGMAEFDFGLTHVWGQTLIKSQENPLVLDFSQNTDQSMAVTMGMIATAQQQAYRQAVRQAMMSTLNGAGLTMMGWAGAANSRVAAITMFVQGGGRYVFIPGILMGIPSNFGDSGETSVPSMNGVSAAAGGMPDPDWEPNNNGDRSPNNLPSHKKINIDMKHVLDRHTVTGKTFQQRSQGTHFPREWGPKQIERHIRNAYKTGVRAGPTQPHGAFLMRGNSGGLRIEMWVNKATKTIETAYPIF